MFDFRTTNDVLRDIQLLNDAITELQAKDKMLSACLLTLPIEKIKECKHADSIEGLHEKKNCKKCKGTGYEVIVKKEV